MDFNNFKNAKSGRITVKDSNGQNMYISLALQYRIKKDKIPDLYTAYQTDYETTMKSFVDSTVRNTVGKFGPYKFWQNRTGAGKEIRAALNKKF